MATGSAPEGLYLRGTLRGGKPQEGRERPNGEGRYPDRYHVHILANDEVWRVEYRDEDTARAAVEEAAGGPVSPGDVVTLPVRARAGARGGAEAFVFWSGVAAGADERADVTW